MDRVWDTFKYPPKSFVSLCQVIQDHEAHPRFIQDHEVKKGQIKNFEFGWCDTCFQVKFSSRTQKLTLEYFLNGPNRTKSENRKMAEILVNSVKVTFFGRSKRKNSAVFQDINLNFVHIFIGKCSFTYIPFVWKIKKTLGKLRKTKSFFCIFQISELKKIKIPDSSLIGMFNPHLLKTNWFYL